MSFQCPVCTGTHYKPVVVNRPRGGRYVTEFYACSNCSVMFLQPERFSARRSPKVVSVDFRNHWQSVPSIDGDQTKQTG